MAKLKLWSATPGSNNSAAPNGWPEGMAPSDVNNTARQDRASIREWYEDAEWIERGDSIESASGSQIVFTGDTSAVHRVGRSVRSDGTIGVITAVSVASNTTVTVDGIAFGGTPSVFEVGILNRSLNDDQIVAALGYTPVSKDGLDADLSAGGYNITNLASPVNSTDAASKSYVNSVVSMGGDPSGVAITDLDNGDLEPRGLLSADGSGLNPYSAVKTAYLYGYGV